jgi:hypothetical protein
VTSVISAAAEEPVRNSPGSEKKTGKQLYAPMATAEKRTTESNGERGAPSNSMTIPDKAAAVAM